MTTGVEDQRGQSVDEVAQEALKSNPLSGALGIVPRALAAIGDFYAFCLKTMTALFRRGVVLDEFVAQAWFVAGVSIMPAIMVSIPLCVIIVFQVNQLLIQIGAVDLAGTAAAVAVIREIGPIVSVLVVAGAGATAVCADLGSRKIREELDAMEVLGIDPIHRLVVPRVVAMTLIAIALNAVVSVVGLVGGFFFSTKLQGATPGLFVDGLTLLIGTADFIAANVKAAVFGLLAGLAGCYLGVNAKGGPKGVGDAVNQTVVVAFMMLFAANTIITSIFLQLKAD